MPFSSHEGFFEKLVAAAYAECDEDLLVQQWDSLPWGSGLKYVGRQIDCGKIGRIDVLAQDRVSGDYVVIELKRDQGDDEVVGQVSRYMGWINENRASRRGVGVRGIIVVQDASARLRAAVSIHPTIRVYIYRFALSLQPLGPEA